MRLIILKGRNESGRHVTPPSISLSDRDLLDYIYLQVLFNALEKPKFKRISMGKGLRGRMKFKC